MRATRKRLNVLHVATINKPITSDMGYGPIETVIYNIDKGLSTLGHRSIVACSSDSSVSGQKYGTVPQSLGDYLREDTREGRASVDRHLANALARAKRGDIDVVHMHEWFEYVCDGRFAPGVPIVTTLHVSGLHSGIEEFRAMHPDAPSVPSMHYVAISEYQRRQYAHLIPVAKTIPHGLDTNEYTVAAVIAGLRGAANFARVFQDASRAETYDTVADQMAAGVVKHLFHTGHRRYARSGYRNESGYELDEVIDVSLLGLATLGALPLDDSRIVATVEAVRRQLTLETPIGGLARYQNDRYQREDDVPEPVPGNPWFISMLWLGEYLVAHAGNFEELHEALPCLEWCSKNALPSGVLAEQVHPVKGYPLSVSPLTWSHAAYVWVVLQYVEKFDSLRNDAADAPPPCS